MTSNSVSQAQANVKEGFGLLQKRKAMYESAKAQTDAVKDAFKQMQSGAASQGKKVENIKDDLAQKITVLSNFKITEQPDEANYYVDIKKADGESMDEKEFDEASYNRDLNEFKQYQALDKQIKEETKKLGIEEKDLETLKKAAQDKEQELMNKEGLSEDAKKNYDFSLKEYEKLQKDLEKAEFEIKLDKKGDNLTKVGTNKLTESSINGASADNKTVYNGIVAGDKANGADSSKQHYTHQQVGDSHKYNFDQVKAMGGEAMDFDLSDDFVISSAGLNELAQKLDQEDAKPDAKPNENQGAKPDATPDANPGVKNPNEHYHSGGVTKARGIPYNDKKTDADYGFKHDDEEKMNYSLKDLEERNAAGNGARTAETSVRSLSDDELNASYRKAEETVHPGYSKLLDKAENFDIDIDSIVKPGMSGDDAYKAVKDAVKAKEAEAKEAKKLNKAEQKYATEIQQYGLDSADYKTADELKAAVKAAKSKPQTKAAPEPDKVATQSKSETATIDAGAKTGTSEPTWSDGTVKLYDGIRSSRTIGNKTVTQTKTKTSTSGEHCYEVTFADGTKETYGARMRNGKFDIDITKRIH